MDKKIEESIGELTGEVPVEKVFLQEETKLYRLKAVLGYPAITSSPFAPDNNLVPVYSDDMKQLGFARVFVKIQGGMCMLMAEMTIDYACEERLLLETQSVKLLAETIAKYSESVKVPFDVAGIRLTDRGPWHAVVTPVVEPS